MFFSIIFNTLPFKSVKKQVIYTENEYNEHINRYIQCNYTSICQYFAQQGYEFCYLPFLARELSADNIISYYAPFATKIQSCDISNDFLLQYMANPQNRTKISPSLLYFSHSEDNVDIYSGIKLDDTSFLYYFNLKDKVKSHICGRRTYCSNGLLPQLSLPTGAIRWFRCQITSPHLVNLYGCPASAIFIFV